MPWTIPRDWSTGLRVTSAIANLQWRGNQTHLYDANSSYIYSMDSTQNFHRTEGGAVVQGSAERPNYLTYYYHNRGVNTNAAQFDRSPGVIYTVREYKPHAMFSWNFNWVEHGGGKQDDGSNYPGLPGTWRTATGTTAERRRRELDWIFAWRLGYQPFSVGQLTDFNSGWNIIARVFDPSDWSSRELKFSTGVAPGWNWLHLCWFSVRNRMLFSLETSGNGDAFLVQGHSRKDSYMHLMGLPSAKPQSTS